MAAVRVAETVVAVVRVVAKVVVAREVETVVVARVAVGAALFPANLIDKVFNSTRYLLDVFIF